MFINYPEIKYSNLLHIPQLIILLYSFIHKYKLYFGHKKYEHTDRLGNVRVVINDLKTWNNAGGYYTPNIWSVSDYYAFGSEISERMSNYAYRYSFNGKEDLQEQRRLQDYGARFYNKMLGRFISADPLIVMQKKYAWLSSYQFASNTPIQAKDVDGLEAYFVHGTWSNESTWSEGSVNMIMSATDNKEKVLFPWSGNNVHSARYEAALKLVNEIYKTRNPDEPLTLVGHSHGGNVAILAANIIQKLGGKVDKLITINTPVRPDYQLNEGAVKEHVNVYTDIDLVQISGGNKGHITNEFKENCIFLDKGFVSFKEPKISKGEEFPLGEVGPAERTFKDAKNIKYNDSRIENLKNNYLPNGHHGHARYNVNKWKDKIKK